MRQRPALVAATLTLLFTCVAYAAISISSAAAVVQNFDSLGAVAAAPLPADFRVDNPVTVRTVGSYASASTATVRLGGASLSTSAANGIYNFGSGTTTNGGADRAVGFLSSGTATASGNLYAQLANTTAGSLSGLQVSYSVEKYRGGSNPNGFRIQLFYSTDGVAWTDAGASFTTAFAADAANTGFATAPGATVAVNQPLNVAIPSGALFYLAWNYSVAAGTTTTNAQALAIDDISIQGIAPAGSPTNPTAAGAFSPSTVEVGGSTLLAVSVTPGTNPASSGIAVTADLSSIGGAAAQTLFDDGTHGDVTAGDNTFSFAATVPFATAGGAKTIAVSVRDAQNRTAAASVPLTVQTPSPPTGTASANPATVLTGGSTLLTVKVTPGSTPASTGLSVVGNLTSIGGSATQPFFDDGTNGDAAAGDNVFSYRAAVLDATPTGSRPLGATISDAQGRSTTASFAVTVRLPPPTTVKISQVYGGGGNSGATYTNDFIEIFNDGATPVDVAGWSVQYSSAGATTWSATSICPSGSCLVLPGHYFLVQEAQGAAGTTALPTADAVGAIAMSGTQAKVALVADTAALGGACPADPTIVDLVGYGAANCFEAAPTALLSNTTAAVRRGNGCVDSDNNAADFVTIGPIPRNSASPVNSCGGDPAQPSGLGIASPASLDPASSTLLTVKVAPATAPPSTGIAVVADLTSIGGSATQTLFDDGTHGDVAAGDNLFSVSALVGTAIQTGAKSIVATIADAEGRVATAPITLTVQSPTCGVERWSVKVGSDATVGLVDLGTRVPAAIFDLGMVTPPLESELDTTFSAARVAPVETTLYTVDATMTFYKKETDVDYHIVLQDADGHTLISEIPSPACVITSTSPRVLVPSPLAAGIAKARAAFDSHLTATTFFQIANVPVRVTGVGFFDFEHGQTGVAPNAIELHPVLDISFRGNTSTTLASSANPSVYGQSVVLTATVTGGDGNTVPTGEVVFFYDGNSVTVPLDPGGQAKYSTNALTAGTHAIVAAYGGDDTSVPSTSAPVSEVVAKADQTIDVAPLAGKTFGDADFEVAASASSGLPVTLGIASGPATIAGSTVHIAGAGTVTVRASQAGDDNYNAATDVDRSFVVARAAQTILFATLSNRIFGEPAFGVSATGGKSGNPVTFAASGPCAAGGVNGATITLTGIGVCTVTASQAGSANYDAAPDVPRMFQVFDRTPPAIASVTPSVASIWPPNRQMVPVSFAVAVSDDVDPAPACRVTGVSSNEGSSADWQIADASTVNLRADRLGSGQGRVYVVTVRCVDASGNESSATATVVVPHDQGR